MEHENGRHAPTPDTAGLIGACLAGDQDAWNQLVQRFSPLVWGVVAAYGVPPEDGQDVYQTTWLRVVEHLAVLCPDDCFAAWLHDTTRRECLGHFADTPRHLPLGADFPADGFPGGGFAPEAETPETETPETETPETETPNRPAPDRPRVPAARRPVPATRGQGDPLHQRAAAAQVRETPVHAVTRRLPVENRTAAAHEPAHHPRVPKLFPRPRP